MANYQQDFEEIGRNIQQIIDQAVKSQDFSKLNQTIVQKVSRAVDVGGEAVRKAADHAVRAADHAARAAGDARRSAADRPRTVTAEPSAPPPVLYGSTEGRTAAGIAGIAGGSILSIFGFSGSMFSLMLSALWGGTSGAGIFSGILLGLGIILIAGGIRRLNRIGRFKKYRRLLGENTHCSLEKMARSVGKSVKFLRKDLAKMIDDGLFLEGHLDKEEMCLITSHETFRHYEQSRLELEARKREEKRQEEAKKAESALGASVREVLERGNAFVAQIRRCNDAIDGEEISGKIARMELIVGKIFARAQAHPEIVPDLKKLMDYYLPMTIKLLNAYAEMDAQPVQGENIRTAKKEIEATLDTLNLAFEKLLDSVFEDTAMDISSDISVLNTLLAQEGLTEDELTKLKKREI